MRSPGRKQMTIAAANDPRGKSLRGSCASRAVGAVAEEASTATTLPPVCPSVGLSVGLAGAVGRGWWAGGGGSAGRTGHTERGSVRVQRALWGWDGSKERAESGCALWREDEDDHRG